MIRARAEIHEVTFQPSVRYTVGKCGDRICSRAHAGRLEIAGGWFMLVFGISIFAVRYALGVVFGMAPALRADSAWIALAGGVGGFVAGLGLGWLGAVGGRSSRWIRRLRWAPAIFLLTVAAGLGGTVLGSARSTRCW